MYHTGPLRPEHALTGQNLVGAGEGGDAGGDVDAATGVARPALGRLRLMQTDTDGRRESVVAPMLHFGLVLRLATKAAAAPITKGTLTTLGGFVIEVDDVPGSNLRAGGTVSLKGRVTTKLPSDLPVP